MAKLKSETDTPAMERRVLRAFLDFQNYDAAHARQISVDFEHGHWWVTDKPTGAQWSVVDATGGASVDGFDFEQVSEGDDG